MKQPIIASIDIGLTGAISLGHTTYPMPTINVETKPAVMVLALDSKGKKQYYKSGPLKGQPKHKIKTPAKYSKKLDIKAIYDILNTVDIVVIESQGTSFGNSAKSTRTTAFNAGQLHAVAELANCQIHYVAPHKWKADLNLPADKLPTVELAEKLSPDTLFRSPKGALYDGMADAFCIHHWFEKFTLPTL